MRQTAVYELLYDRHPYPVDQAKHPACKDTIQYDRAGYGENLASDAEHLAFFFVLNGVRLLLIKRKEILVLGFLCLLWTGNPHKSRGNLTEIPHNRQNGK